MKRHRCVVFAVTNNLRECPKPWKQQSLACPLQRGCVKLVSFYLPMAWLWVLSLLKNTIFHPILIKTNAFYISGMGQIICREVNKNKVYAILICFTRSVYNLKKERKEHPVLQHLPSTFPVTDCELRHYINIERGDDFSLFNIKD